MMAFGALSFLLAVITGIWRAALTRGFLLSPIPEWWPPHGHLMIGGFLATLIMFERMVALRIHFLIWVPYSYALTAIFLHTGWWPLRVVHFAALAGWLWHCRKAIQVFHNKEKPLVESVAYLTLSLALNYPGGLPASPTVSLAALSFPVAAIAVERLELSLQFQRKGSRAILWGLILWCILWISSVWTAFPPLNLMGFLTLLLFVGITCFDTALRRSPQLLTGGLHSFLRVALYVAYGWLLLSSLAMILWNRLEGAIAKDLVFHLIGLGFIFSMILAHAPIILASTLGKLPPLKPAWVPFVLFQAMTVLRAVGDLSVSHSVSFWTWTGWISGVGHLFAFLGYVAVSFTSLRRPAPPSR